MIQIRLALQDIRTDYARFVRKAFLKSMIYLSPLQTPLGAASVVVQDGQLVLREFEVTLDDPMPVLPVAVVTTQPDHPPTFRLRTR